jgi:hypothetical protein
MIELTDHLIERTALHDRRGLPHFGFGQSIPDQANRDMVSREEQPMPSRRETIFMVECPPALTKGWTQYTS